MKPGILLFLLTLALTLSSCAVLHKTDVVPSTGLDSDNYEYVRTVKAKISYTYVICFGGLTEKSLMRELTKAANLQAGEALVNVSVQSRFKFFLLVFVKDFIATGQVVRFKDLGRYMPISSTDKIDSNETQSVIATPVIPISKDRQIFEELINTPRGYEGDKNSAMPVKDVIYAGMDCTTKAGVDLEEKDVIKPFFSSNVFLLQKYGLSNNNKMSVKVMDCSEEIKANGQGGSKNIELTVSGFAETTDDNGKMVARILFEGKSSGWVYSPEDLKKLYQKSFEKAAKTMFGC